MEPAGTRAEGVDIENIPENLLFVSVYREVIH